MARRLNFFTITVVPREQNTETYEFSTSRDFAVRCWVYVVSIVSSEREIIYEGRFVYCLFVCFSRCISNCGAKVSPQDGLSLEAICYGELCKKTSSYKWSLHLVSFSRDTFSILDVSDAAVKPSKSKNHVLINISKLHRDTARKRLYYLVKAVIHLDDHIEVEGNFSFVVN